MDLALLGALAWLGSTWAAYGLNRDSLSWMPAWLNAATALFLMLAGLALMLTAFLAPGKRDPRILWIFVTSFALMAILLGMARNDAEAFQQASVGVLAAVLVAIAASHRVFEPAAAHNAEEE